MGLLHNGITIIHFDETYFSQQKLLSYPHDDINFLKMKHVNLYCEEDSLIILKKRLQKRERKGITFLGSGNYHYVSYLLLKERQKPFTLVLFDNHPDLGIGEKQDQKLLSCGSWVSYALDNIPLLKQVMIIGPTAVSDKRIRQPRTYLFPFDGSHHYSIKSILSAIPTPNIYISIDKDVIKPPEVLTNWDQGIMDIHALTSYMNVLLKEKQVEGIDICGEEHFSPLEALLPEDQTIIRQNEKANLKILQTCLKESQIQTKGA